MAHAHTHNNTIVRGEIKSAQRAKFLSKNVSARARGQWDPSLDLSCGPENALRPGSHISAAFFFHFLSGPTPGFSLSLSLALQVDGGEGQKGKGEISNKVGEGLRKRRGQSRRSASLQVFKRGKCTRDGKKKQEGQEKSER